jgi:hypothetical protein
MYGQTDGRTDELIRVGLGNQRFLQVNTESEVEGKTHVC